MRPRSRCTGRTAFRFWSFRSTMTGPSPRSSAVAADPQSSAMRTGAIVDDTDIDDVPKRTNAALDDLRRALKGPRTGRSSPGLLEPSLVTASRDQVPTTHDPPP